MSKLITLESDEGEILLKEILGQTNSNKKYVQPYLISCHYQQKTNATCGIASTLMLLNARLRYLNINPWTEYELLMHKNLLKPTNKKLANIFKNGLTLKQASDILHSFKCDNKYQMLTKKNDKNEIDKFRDFCKQIFVNHDSKKGMIVNYWMPDIGQTYAEYGHLSPIGAYNERTDRVLLLDSWPPSKPLWVKIESLYNAMCTLDHDDEYRGYIVVNNVNIDALVNKTSKL